MGRVDAMNEMMMMGMSQTLPPIQLSATAMKIDIYVI